MKEPENMGQKQVSKVTLHFVLGHLSKKQTVSEVNSLSIAAILMNHFKVLSETPIT